MLNRILKIIVLVFIPLVSPGQIPNELHFEFINTENQPKTEYITQFNQDDKGNIWISSLRGLFKFDGYRSDLHVHDPNDSLSLINNRVFSTFLSQNGDLWICAARGVQRYNEKDDVFEPRLQSYIKSQKDLYNISFYCALDLDQDRLLLGYKRGVMVYNHKTDIVEKIDTLDYRSKVDAFSSSTHVIKMTKDNVDSDIIWLLTRMGLFKYHKGEQRAELIANDLNIQFLENMDRGYALVAIGNEILLLSNYFHIYSYHKLKREWTKIKDAPSVNNDGQKKHLRNIFGIGDEYALLVYMFDGIKKYTPESKFMYPITTKFDEGLDINIFSDGIIDANGYLLFVNGNEKYIRTKNKLVPRNKKPVFALSDLRINEIEASNSLFYQDKLILKDYERNIQFKMGIEYPDLNVPTQYFYSLDQKRNKWNPIAEDRLVDLSNLNSGEYSVYGKVVYGEEQIEQHVLSFQIQPYFYETWWFKLVIAIIFGCVAYLFYWQYQSRKLDKQEFNTALLDLQMNSLRSQMNPHFLFNSLNSIKNYMVNKGPDEAAEYLTRFSLLIRKILENSRKKLMTLEDEVEMLDLYIEMENKRFSEKFSYKLEIDESIDQSHFYLAPMIIQPYIENAIWHGLMNKEADRNLSVRFLPSDENVICYIVDNGIGRVEARKRKKFQSSNKKSLGMEITGDHIVAINKLYQINAKVDIEDCYDQKGNPIGTKVKIFLPRLHKL